MFSTQLQQAGLSENQAIVYEALLKTGTAPARAILANIPLKRGLAYKVLDELAKQGIVIKKDEPGKVATFEPCHPAKLKEIAEAKEKQAQNAQVALEGILGQLSSDYNLATGKPGVRFFEGLEGVKRVLNDTLESNPDKKLYVFSSVASYFDLLLDWNTKHYAPRRQQLKIYEKVIVPNNPKTLALLKNYQANDITENLFIDYQMFPFATEVNIYNNKVSFVTFSASQPIGVIIDNQEIYNTMLTLFKLCWELGRKNLGPLQPDWLGERSRPQPFVSPTVPPHTSEQTAVNPK